MTSETAYTAAQARGQDQFMKENKIQLSLHFEGALQGIFNDYVLDEAKGTEQKFLQQNIFYFKL